MKIFIMTDIEGVCGVVNFHDWALPTGRYYEEGKELLTLEVNAAIEGFITAGATEIVVCDGHGHGAINNLILDQRVEFLRGPVPGPFPFMLDETFDAIAWVGQHAKAGTECAQMAHTGNFSVIEYTVNGLSIGEFGQMALCAASLGVRSIFGSGDLAFTKEAEALVGGIQTVAVKRGIMPGSGDELEQEPYILRNNGAIHLHPVQARKRIREGAEKALRRYIDNKEQFTLLSLDPPYKREVKYRQVGEKDVYTRYNEHPNNIIALLNGRRS